MDRPVNRRRRSENNRRLHHKQRAEQAEALGAKGIAAAWAEQVRAVARDRARRGDSSGWEDLARHLEWFCSRHPPADPADRRTVRQAEHWEQRLADLADADPKTVASAWWDRARSVAAAEGDTGWADLGLTLKNLADRYSP
ncbi:MULTISPECIES: hypothetical protein [unclassified Streptomyces]|uniref:hypothetical protein n=1 Tax=unclassified Streptomyces TaxID=2593676 RepID=UPI0018F79CE5|nr:MULTISPECIES: hypothetical protein [unclassified Streptomyces]